MLTESLKFCTNSQTLDISMNNIGSDGAAAFAELLESCTNLQTLYISENKIGSRGRQELHTSQPDYCGTCRTPLYLAIALPACLPHQFSVSLS